MDTPETPSTHTTSPLEQLLWQSYNTVKTAEGDARDVCMHMSGALAKDDPGAANLFAVIAKMHLSL